jgi:hypothetical protein
VLRKHGHDLEELATSYARVAAFVESQPADPQTLVCDPPGAARAAVKSLEGDT